MDTLYIWAFDKDANVVAKLYLDVLITVKWYSQVHKQL